MTSIIKEKVSLLDETLRELAERTARLDARERELEARLAKAEWMVAQGSLPTSTEPPRVKSPSHGDIEKALRTGCHDARSLARALRVPLAAAQKEIARLRRAGALHNAGSAELPRWTWKVAGDCTRDDLYAAVEALISERPTTFAELLAATGCERGQVSSVLQNLERKGRKVQNLGTVRRARWFIPAVR